MKKLNFQLPLLFISLVLMVFLSISDTFAAILDNYYNDLQILDKSTNISRKSYISTANGFYKIYTTNPSGKDADEALLGAARSYRRSYERYKVKDDIDKSLRYYSMLQGAFASDAARNAYLETSDIFRTLKDPASAKFSLNKLINKYPESSQAKTAVRTLASINSNDSGNRRVVPDNQANVTNVQMVGNTPSIASKNPIPRQTATPVKASAPGEAVTVSGIRYYSDKDYTRVVIDISGKADYRSLWLKEDKGINRPPRLTIDVDGSIIVPDIPRQIIIKDGLLSSVRLGYHAKDKRTRIVLDSENIKDFTVFQMSSPSRIVVDLFSYDKGGEKPPVVATRPNKNNPPVITARPKQGQKSDGGTLNITDVLGLKIKTIVIDAGHGGKDPGAVYNNIKEKDIILDIAKDLRDMLKKDPSLTVYMTRDTDVFIPLEERTALANKYKADIFVSIHANAAKNTAASGVETYVFNVTNDRAALEVAALENNATTKATSDLSDILKDILKYSKLEDSLLLAGAVHKSIINSTGGKPKSLGVKQAPFYVLLGARMPSILIETGFITNKEEAGRLKTQSYRKQISTGIYEGLQGYISKYNNK